MAAICVIMVQVSVNYTDVSSLSPNYITDVFDISHRFSKFSKQYFVLAPRVKNMYLFFHKILLLHNFQLGGSSRVS